MDRRKGKGKVSETSSYDDWLQRKEDEAEKRRAEIIRSGEQSIFIKKMKIFKSREERKGKDWVKTKDEFRNFDLYNDETATEFCDGRKKLDADLKDRKISEEEWYRLVIELANRTDKKFEDMLDAEEAEMAKYVKEYEARERQFPPEN